jgi:hypothetical protein
LFHVIPSTLNITLFDPVLETATKALKSAYGPVETFPNVMDCHALSETVRLVQVIPSVLVIQYVCVVPEEATATKSPILANIPVVGTPYVMDCQALLLEAVRLVHVIPSELV